MKKTITTLGVTLFAILFLLVFSQKAVATDYWSYYVNENKDLSSKVFSTQDSCQEASSNRLGADKNVFYEWQNCFLSDSNGTPIIGDAIPVTPKEKNTPSWSEYKLLAPFAGFDKAPENVGDYLNKIFMIGIGLCGALAVLMMILAGIQYMGEESIFEKSKWRERFKSAIFGLLIALSAYALLNTIDPRLLGGEGLSIRAVTAAIVDYPDVGDRNVDSKCKEGNATYSTSINVSSGVTNAIKKITGGFQLSKLEVDSQKNEMSIVLKNKNGEIDSSSKIKMSPGWKGYAEVNNGKTNDQKTPKGVWKVINKVKAQDKAAVCSKSGSNMGAGFWRLNPTTNGERGIGIHGNENGSYGTTNGCIRITNADILALDPYINSGLVVEVK